MLVAACELREVFACSDTHDLDYKMDLSLQEWKQVETLCKYVMYLFLAADLVTAPAYHCASTFFPVVSTIQYELMHAAMSEDSFVRLLIRPLDEKFDKYWKNCCFVLALAAILDPRYKMGYVKYAFSRIYGQDAANAWIKIVDDELHELWLEYRTPQETVLEEVPLDLSEFDEFVRWNKRSELEKYLEEAVEWHQRGAFDVLGWWRLNRSKYPTLSKMASDILSIAVSTIAPNSVFDTEISKRVDDSYLTPANLEALLCAKNWLQ